MAYILIIDDDTEILELSKSILKSIGHRVFTSHQPNQGQGLIEKHFPDIVLLDINMPGKDGMTVLKSIKALAQANLMAIVMMTGVSDVHVVQEAKRLGVADYIVKPIKNKVLGEKIARIEQLLQEKNRQLIMENRNSAQIQRKAKYTVVEFSGPVSPSSVDSLTNSLNPSIRLQLKNFPVFLDIRNQYQMNKDQIVLVGKIIQLFEKNKVYMVCGKNYGVFSQLDILDFERIFIQFEDAEKALQIR